MPAFRTVLIIFGAKIGGTVQNFECSEDSIILPPKQRAGKKPQKGQHSVLFFYILGEKSTGTVQNFE